MGKKNRKNKSKGGRPRKAGERYPSGKLKPIERRQAESVVGSSAMAPTLVHRVREQARALGLDPRLGTELGRLLLVEQINHLEAAAGFRLAEVYGRFERQHGRRRTAKSPSYEMGFGPGSGPDHEAPDSDTSNYLAVQHHLIKDCGYPSRVRDLLEQLCVDDQPIGPAGIADVRPVLSRLGREHFKMHAAVIAGPPTPRSGERAARPKHQVPITPATQRHEHDRQRLVAILDGPRGALIAAETLAFAVSLLDRSRFRDKKQRDEQLEPAR